MAGDLGRQKQDSYIYEEHNMIQYEPNSNELMGIFHLAFHHIRFIL